MLSTHLKALNGLLRRLIALKRLEERKYPSRFSGDYFRDTLPADLYELEAGSKQEGHLRVFVRVLQGLYKAVYKGLCKGL